MTDLPETIDPEAPEHRAWVDNLTQVLASELGERFEVHYAELRRLARSERRRIDVGGAPTLNTTALVHELYLKFLHAGAAIPQGKHFFALAALAVRRILVDRARHRQIVRQHADAHSADDGTQDGELLEVHEALDKLRRVNPRLAAVVTCRWFAGYSDAETADALGASERTVRRDWERARIWLAAAMTGPAP